MQMRTIPFNMKNCRPAIINSSSRQETWAMNSTGLKRFYLFSISPPSGIHGGSGYLLLLLLLLSLYFVTRYFTRQKYRLQLERSERKDKLPRSGNQVSWKCRLCAQMNPILFSIPSTASIVLYLRNKASRHQVTSPNFPS